MIRPLSLAAALAGTFFLAGCASLPEAPPEETVARRARARWDAVIANDWKTAWSYTSPAFRARFTPENYARYIGGHVRRNGAEVLRVICLRPEEKPLEPPQEPPQEQAPPPPPPPVDITACDATIRMPHNLLMPGVRELTSEFPERWVKDEDGKWYIYHREAH
jgi:hypothetical protein